MTDPAAGAAAAATDPELNPELVAEQRHLDAAYARLEAMRRAAEQVAEGYTDVTRGGTHQARLEREAAEAYTRRRLASFDIGESPLCFGRLDLRPGERGRDAGPYYIGRISVTDDDLTPLVVDWRAPVAEPFYRATAVEPMGVARRRHFQTQRPASSSASTTRCSTPTPPRVRASRWWARARCSPRSTRSAPAGCATSSPRSRPSRTKRSAPTSPAILVVAGGPGTGKTAVALHRAAYLLYTHRKRLGAQGVLLVGPSPIFLRYIDEVLPSLGEDEVQLATPAALKPRLKVRADASRPPPPRSRAIVRMAKVIAAAIA